MGDGTELEYLVQHMLIMQVTCRHMGRRTIDWNNIRAFSLTFAFSRPWDSEKCQRVPSDVLCIHVSGMWSNTTWSCCFQTNHTISERWYRLQTLSSWWMNWSGLPCTALVSFFDTWPQKKGTRSWRLFFMCWDSLCQEIRDKIMLNRALSMVRDEDCYEWLNASLFWETKIRD